MHPLTDPRVGAMTHDAFEIEWFEEIGSTNTYLMERARGGSPGRQVAVADFQSAGRGRLDRRWEAPPRSALLVSVLVREQLAPEELYLATAVVALSGAAAAERASGARPGLKWPNDLIFEQGKVAGILAEADPTAPGGRPGTTAVVIGMGMNLTWPGPPGVGGTSLLDVSGTTVERDQMLALFLDELDGRLELLGSSQGRRGILAEVERSLVTIGQEVLVELATGQVRGQATGLSPEGFLLVESDDGIIEVAAGDIVHLRPADPGPQV